MDNSFDLDEMCNRTHIAQQHIACVPLFFDQPGPYQNSIWGQLCRVDGLDQFNSARMVRMVVIMVHKASCLKQKTLTSLEARILIFKLQTNKEYIQDDPFFKNCLMNSLTPIACHKPSILPCCCRTDSIQLKNHMQVSLEKLNNIPPFKNPNHI